LKRTIIAVMILLVIVLQYLVYLPVAIAECRRNCEPTDTPTITPTGPTATPTATATPAPYSNLLINPYFDWSLDGWSMINDLFTVSWKSCTPSPSETSAQIDRDGDNLWQGGEEDWLWQDVYTSETHTQVVFSFWEVHHMHTGLAEKRLYGSYDNVNWSEIWFSPDPEAEYGSGKPNCINPWPFFMHTFQSDHPYYRIEFHFLAQDPNDGWKFTSLDLHVEP
jgi:hypothetical protein